MLESLLREERVHRVHCGPRYPPPGSFAYIPAHTLPSSPILNAQGRNREQLGVHGLSIAPESWENSKQKREQQPGIYDRGLL